MPSLKADDPNGTDAPRGKQVGRPAARRRNTARGVKVVDVAGSPSPSDKKRVKGKPGGGAGKASPRVAARRTPHASKGAPTGSVSASHDASVSETRSHAGVASVVPAQRPAAKARRPKARATNTPSVRAERAQNGGAPTSRATERAIAPVAATAAAGAVLVTGICGRLGRLLARRLHRTDRVVGVDRRPFVGRPKDIVHHELDLRRKTTRDLFRGGSVRAVVHLGVLHDPRASDKEHHSWNIVGFQKLLDYLARYRVPKLVVLSSANVYGPQPDNPQFLTEDAPLLGAQSFRGIRDLVELDMLAQGFFWKNPETETVILRPCHILGRVHNAPSNYLRLERPMTVLGFDPMVQPVHERDVVDAALLALRPGVRGIFNLRGPGEAPLSRILAMLGRRPRAVPSMIAKAVLERLWTYRLTSFPAPELDYLRFLCMVDDTRAREGLGYDPQYDLQQTVQAVKSDR